MVIAINKVKISIFTFEKLPIMGLPMYIVPQTTSSFKIIFATKVVAINFNGFICIHLVE
jgi:hypothetical protein